MEVLVDYWENQRYKPLQGGWTKPFTGNPSFSDVSYKNSCHPDQIANVNWNAGNGWEWLQPNFEIDRSGEFGKVDEEGWSYAISFEKLLEQTKTKTLNNERSALYLARRRRWVRTRICKSQSLRNRIQIRIDYVESLQLKMNEVIETNEQVFSKIRDYSEQRQKATEKILVMTDASFAEINSMLNTLHEKLTSMNTFLRERGEIECKYSSKMAALGHKWLNAGSTGAQRDDKNVAGTVSPSSSNGGGFFHVVSTAHLCIAERLIQFSSLLTNALPNDVDIILGEVRETLDECVKEKTKLREKVVLKVRMGELSLENYRLCQQVSTMTIKKESETLHALLHTVCASTIKIASVLTDRTSLGTVSSPGPTASILAGSQTVERFGGVNNTPSTAVVVSDKGECVNNLHQTDVWLAMRSYYSDLIEVDSAILLYHALSKKLRRTTDRISLSVAQLLKSTVKVFAHEQFRVWEDSAQMLESVGMPTIASTSTNNNSFIHRENGGSEDGNSGQNLHSNSQGEQSTMQKLFSSTADERYSGSTLARDRARSPHTAFEAIAVEDEFDEEEDEEQIVKNCIDLLVRKASYFPQMPHSQSYAVGVGSRARLTSMDFHEYGFAICGRMKHLLVYSVENALVTAIVGTTNSGKVEISDDTFTEVLIAITFDRVMHIFKIPQEYGGQSASDSEENYHSGYEKKNLLLSVNLKNAEIALVFIPKEGFRDAFEITFASQSVKHMAPAVLSVPASSSQLSGVQSTALSASSAVASPPSGAAAPAAAAVVPSPPLPVNSRSSFTAGWGLGAAEWASSFTGGSSSTSTSLAGNIPASPPSAATASSQTALKPLSSIIFVADSSNKVLEWMRAAKNPFSDHSVDPPMELVDDDSEHIDIADLYSSDDWQGGGGGSGGNDVGTGGVEKSSLLDEQVL